VDAAFYAADGVVILKFAFSKLKIQFKSNYPVCDHTPAATKNVASTPLKRGISITFPLQKGE
jgi:hypothetical protein